MSGWVLRIPKQFGPISDIRYRRAIRISSSSRAIPSPPTSRNPEEITTRPFVPRRPSDSTAPATSGAGMMITARSGASGRSPTRA